MSKERRVDPKSPSACCATRAGSRWRCTCSKETKTLIPVLKAFQDAHDVKDMVFVADAGMLSAANLLALEGAGFSFVLVGGTRLAGHLLADDAAEQDRPERTASSLSASARNSSRRTASASSARSSAMSSMLGPGSPATARTTAPHASTATAPIPGSRWPSAPAPVVQTLDTRRCSLYTSWCDLNHSRKRRST